MSNNIIQNFIDSSQKIIEMIEAKNKEKNKTSAFGYS